MKPNWKSMPACSMATVTRAANLLDGRRGGLNTVLRAPAVVPALGVGLVHLRSVWSRGGRGFCRERHRVVVWRLPKMGSSAWVKFSQIKHSSVTQTTSQRVPGHRPMRERPSGSVANRSQVQGRAWQDKPVHRVVCGIDIRSFSARRKSSTNEIRVN